MQACPGLPPKRSYLHQHSQLVLSSQRTGRPALSPSPILIKEGVCVGCELTKLGKTFGSKLHVLAAQHGETQLRGKGSEGATFASCMSAMTYSTCPEEFPPCAPEVYACVPGLQQLVHTNHQSHHLHQLRRSSVTEVDI